MAGMLQAGKEFTAADVGSIISELQPDAANDEPRELLAPNPHCVKEEVHTPAFLRADSSQDVASTPAASKLMSFEEMLSVHMTDMPFIDDKPFFTNITELHSLALQIEEILFDKFWGFLTQHDTHKRLTVDVLQKKSQVTLNDAASHDKLVFAGTVSFGEKPKVTLCNGCLIGSDHASSSIISADCFVLSGSLGIKFYVSGGNHASLQSTIPVPAWMVPSCKDNASTTNVSVERIYMNLDPEEWKLQHNVRAAPKRSRSDELDVPKSIPVH